MKETKNLMYYFRLYDPHATIPEVQVAQQEEEARKKKLSQQPTEPSASVPTGLGEKYENMRAGLVLDFLTNHEQEVLSFQETKRMGTVGLGDPTIRLEAVADNNLDICNKTTLIMPVINPVLNLPVREQ